jgi:hypothetical protein
MQQLCEQILTMFVIGACMTIILASLAGCYSGNYYYQPSCIDNPRNMQCFTPSQLEKELNK